MSCGSEMKEHLAGLASSGGSSVSKAADPFKRAKKRPLHQRTGKDEVDEGDLTETKRRLTVEQVNFLETCFSMDIRLEPDRKALLAKQLGVRPRQVAIWFQNRRARWKNKQVEQEYGMLKATYEAVEKEKEKLVKDYKEALDGNKRLQAEVTRLTSLLENTMEKEAENKSPQAKEEQLNDKTELMSLTKSADEQSEVEDLAMSSDANELSTTSTSVLEVVDSTAVVCATRLDGENGPCLPSHVFLSSLPALVQQLIINGYCLEDALHIFFSCEDSFGSGFSGRESC